MDHHTEVIMIPKGFYTPPPSRKKMVFESLLKAESAEKRPFHVFLLGILYSTIGIFFELWIFKGRIANLAIFATMFAAIPLIHTMITFEETKTRSSTKERSLLKEHEKALNACIALFLGMLLSFTFWFILLPQNQAQHIFTSQIDDMTFVKSEVTGRATAPGPFSSVVVHNIMVVIFSFILSFFFAAGAIFILTWNASILAVALGTFVRDSLAAASSASGLPALTLFLGTFSYGFFGYMAHGIFEIASYFIAGLAGGIISVATIRHDLFDQHFKRIIKDASWLMAASILLLLIGGMVEIFLSPLIF